MKLWYISENTFDPQKLDVQKTVYTIGNGYFGTCGAYEEGYPGAYPATLLFGVFDDIIIGKEELANAPDWLPIQLFVNGERFRLDRGKILEYRRTLDMQNAVLSRFVRWESPGGIRLKITIDRFASLADKHVGAIRFSVTAEEYTTAMGKEDLEVVLRATLNTAVGNHGLLHWDFVDQGNEGDLIWLHTQTRYSHVQLVQTMSFTTQAQDFCKEMIDSDIAPCIKLEGKLAIGETITTEKIVTMYTSRDVKDPHRTVIEHHHKIMANQAFNYDTLLAQHSEAWQNFWMVSDIVIEGDDIAQQAIRYNIYQLRLSVSDHDSRYSIAAKGLTGFGYHGHVFHDTEIFILPYFIYVHPHIARNLLLYRYHLLPAAREKAKQNGCEGAQYPWESTLDGREATPQLIIHPESGEPFFELNGFLELHITASIAHAVWQYWRVTSDDEFMCEYGAEMLLSTAMFWASRAENHPENNDYEFNNVIGPDEWHKCINNNAYTNYMARRNIQHAITILDWLNTTAPDIAKQLTQQLKVTDEHLEHWSDVIARMRIPQDKQTGIFEQFDGFFQLKPLDQNKYKGRTASYQAILGMEPVQHYQIIKQADVLMLLTLLDDEFDRETKRVNWDYYYPITDLDYGSSLTPAMHAMLANELGYTEIAYQLFMKAARIDLENLRLNTSAGIHEACCGAVWQALVLAFAGLRFNDEGYITHPNWPEGWTRLSFTCQHKGKLLSIDLRKE